MTARSPARRAIVGCALTLLAAWTTVYAALVAALAYGADKLAAASGGAITGALGWVAKLFGAHPGHTLGAVGHVVGDVAGVIAFVAGIAALVLLSPLVLSVLAHIVVPIAWGDRLITAGRRAAGLPDVPISSLSIAASLRIEWHKLRARVPALALAFALHLVPVVGAPAGLVLQWVVTARLEAWDALAWWFEARKMGLEEQRAWLGAHRLTTLALGSLLVVEYSVPVLNAFGYVANIAAVGHLSDRLERAPHVSPRTSSSAVVES